MKNIVELAEWGKESYDRSVIEPIEQMCGHRLCQRYEELYVDMDNRDGRDCGTLGEVFTSVEGDFYFAWVEWTSDLNVWTKQKIGWKKWPPVNPKRRKNV